MTLSGASVIFYLVAVFQLLLGVLNIFIFFLVDFFLLFLIIVTFIYNASVVVQFVIECVAEIRHTDCVWSHELFVIPTYIAPFYCYFHYS